MTSPDLIPIPTLLLLLLLVLVLVLILGLIPVPTPAPTCHLKSGVLVGTYGKRSTHCRNHTPVQKCVGRLALGIRSQGNNGNRGSFAHSNSPLCHSENGIVRETLAYLYRRGVKTVAKARRQAEASLVRSEKAKGNKTL